MHRIALCLSLAALALELVGPRTIAGAQDNALPQRVLSSPPQKGELMRVSTQRHGEFPNTYTGGSASLTATVTLLTNAPVTVQVGGLSDPFDGNTVINAPAHGKVKFTVHFQPTRADDFTNSFTVQAIAGANTQTVTLQASGTAIAAPFTVSPQQLDFGPVKVGDTATGTITIVNPNADPVLVKVKVKLPSAYVSNLYVPNPIPGGGSQGSIGLSFHPPAGRSYSGEIDFSARVSGHTYKVVLPITGKGVASG